MTWEKKRYDIHIRLLPEDIEIMLEAVIALHKLAEVFNFINFKIGWFKRFDNLYWKIHNKCVEINRKGDKNVY